MTTTVITVCAPATEVINIDAMASVNTDIGASCPPDERDVIVF
jgi:hypothetical protein